MRARRRRQLHALGAALVLFAPRAQAAPLRVRGSASPTAALALRDGALELRGTLRGDAGEPLGGRALGVIISDAAGRELHEPLRTCDGDEAGPLLTGRDGEFCARLGAGSAARRATITVGHEASYDGDTVQVTATSGTTELRLELVGPGSPLSLDEPTARVEVAVVTNSRGGREAVRVQILDASGAARADARVDADGHARLDLPTQGFGPPGPVELRVRAEDDVGTRAELPVRTRIFATPTIRVDGPTLVEADEPTPLHVTVASRFGHPASGTVELTREGVSLASANVVQGLGVATIPSGALPLGTHALRVTFSPDTGDWRSGAWSDLELTLAPRAPWRAAGGLAVVVSLAAWLASGWRRKPAPPATAPRQHVATPEVIAPGTVRSAPARAWSGRVLDAHDGTAVPDAEVTIEVVGFEGATREVAAKTDAGGRFVLPPTARDGRVLVCRTPRHAAWRRPLPPPGPLDILLESRRRHLLRRLGAWVQRASPAPGLPPTRATPGDVARHAARAGGPHAARIAAWARATEAAAYGSDVLDEHREAAVLASEPPP